LSLRKSSLCWDSPLVPSLNPEAAVNPRIFLILPVLVILPQPLFADPPHPAAPGSLGLKDDKDIEALERTLREMIVRNAPDPLFEKGYNWGHLEWVPRGLEWHGKVLPLRPRVQYSFKEDGVWRRLRLTAPNLNDTLILDIRNFRNGRDGTTLFDLDVALGVLVHYDQQTWQNGHRLYAGSVRARLRVKVLLTCAMTTQVEFGKAFLPDVTFRLRVTKADLGHDNFVVEHAYGMGGDLAKKLGETAQAWLHERHPELEQELLRKANAAILKAGDTKEIKLGLGNAFGGKQDKADPARQLLKSPR
jgi:hypothetical protein